MKNPRANGATYDTGALIAAERHDRTLWALHHAYLDAGIAPTVPAGVLAEAWRGGPQPNLSRLLKVCRVEPLTEAQARAVGVLAARSGLDDPVDLSVAEGALRRHDVVVTSNAGDIRQVADAVREPLTIAEI
jgi:predicted nucleic acid-binding protein